MSKLPRYTVTEPEPVERPSYVEEALSRARELLESRGQRDRSELARIDNGLLYWNPTGGWCGVFALRLGPYSCCLVASRPGMIGLELGKLSVRFYSHAHQRAYGVSEDELEPRFSYRWW